MSAQSKQKLRDYRLHRPARQSALLRGSQREQICSRDPLRTDAVAIEKFLSDFHCEFRIEAT
jgi:hypothetical protein